MTLAARPRTLRDADAKRQRAPLRRAVPERLLAKLWAAKAGRRLRTTDGRTVRVLYPGRPAPGHGPDFQDALLELDGRRVHGPVELHMTPAGWTAHGHQHDRAYDGVVLHVVNAPKPSAPSLRMPTVVIDGEPQAGARSGTPDMPLKALAGLDETALRKALRRAGLVRFEERTSNAAKAVAEVGVEQALYAGVLEALGYAENRVPFIALARRPPLSVLSAMALAADAGDRHRLLQDLLLSGSGLAPPSRAWTELVGSPAMDAASWHTAGVRPANHPVRRIEAAAALVAWSLPVGLRARLVEACASGSTGLIEALRLPGAPEGRPLVGLGRAREIAAGAALPILAADAGLRGDRALGKHVQTLYERLPSLPGNTLTREARRLLGPHARVRLNACEHQGLMHAYRAAVG